MRTIVFANGRVEDYRALGRWMRPDDHRVCADGGAAHCRALGLTPHVVVGDLDSIESGLLRDLRESGVAVEEHPADKDETDLELALERAIRDGAGEVLIVGALGGRLDQSVANVLLLARRRWPVPVRLLEGDRLGQVVRGGQEWKLDAAPGAAVSVIPLSSEVTVLSSSGLRYPLDGVTLPFGSTRGISNVADQPPAAIRLHTGTALIVWGSDVSNVTLPKGTDPVSLLG